VVDVLAVAAACSGGEQPAVTSLSSDLLYLPVATSSASLTSYERLVPAITWTSDTLPWDSRQTLVVQKHIELTHANATCLVVVHSVALLPLRLRPVTNQSCYDNKAIR